MTLRASEMPASFTGQALYHAATSEWLGIARRSNLSITMCFQAIAWIVYDIAVNVLVAPLGIAYHSAAAVAHKLRSYTTTLPETQKKQAALAWEHFKSACTDAAGLGLVFILLAYHRSHNSNEVAKYENFLWLWFSSSNVRTTNPPPQPFYLSSHRITDLAPLHWGNPEMPSSVQNSYVNLRMSGYEEWERTRIRRDLEDPNLVHPTLQKDWDTFETRSSFFGWFLIQRPSFQASHYVPPKLEIAEKPSILPGFKKKPGMPLEEKKKPEKPEYSIRWQTVAWILAGVAALCLSFLVLNLFLYFVPGIPYFIRNDLFTGAYLIGGTGLGFVGLALAGLVLILKGVKDYRENRGVAQKNLAGRLMDEIARGASDSSNGQKALRALHWYREAALNGNTFAQRLCGLGMLASLSRHHNAETLEDSELLVLKEAIQWLQSAGINGNTDATQDLRILFGMSNLPANLDLRLYAGVQGDTELDQIKNLFPQGHNFIDLAVEQYEALVIERPSSEQPAEPETDEQIAAKRKNIQLAIAGAQRRPITQEVDKITLVSPDVADIIAAYSV